jgi:hypothetical protein
LHKNEEARTKTWLATQLLCKTVVNIPTTDIRGLRLTNSLGGKIIGSTLTNIGVPAMRSITIGAILAVMAISASPASANWLATCESQDGLCSAQGCGATAAAAQQECFKRCYFGPPGPRLLSVGTSNCTPSGGSSPHQEFVRTQRFSKGCIDIWWHQIYFSPDCQNPAGGGNTVVAYPGDWTNVVALVIVNDCVVTAFTGGGIYKSCDGLNLGGGGNTVKLYEGVRVSEMIACREGGLRVMFKSGDCYTDPSGDHPAGGPGTHHCVPTDICTR